MKMFDSLFFVGADDTRTRVRRAKASIAAFVIAIVLTAICGKAHAQLPTNLYAAGLSAAPGSKPTVAGTALYARKVNDGGTYAFTLIDALPTTSSPLTVTTNVAVGVAQKVATVAGVDVLVPTSAGISWTGTNTGWAWSTGATAIFHPKPNWYLMPTLRVSKSSVSGTTGYQPIFGLLVGWGQ